MHNLLILGAGRMGRLAAYLLANTGDYQIHLVDRFPMATFATFEVSQLAAIHYHSVDLADITPLQKIVQAHSISGLISCLPFSFNAKLIEFALETNLYYFDLTEDTKHLARIETMADKIKKAFVPQCGVAPGFVNIVAADMMRGFEKIDTAKLSVGALPLKSSHPLKYALTWSTEGLINEYAAACDIIENGHLCRVPALQGLESLVIDGVEYELFYTAGGVSSLVQTYLGKVDNLHYKTIRYPGHCEKMRFLMHDMGLIHRRDVLKAMMEENLTTTRDDVVLVYVSIVGKQAGQLIETSYVKKFFAEKLDKFHCSAIQRVTTTSLCAVVDIVLTQPEQYQGWVKQEHITLDNFYQNRLGKYFLQKCAA